MSRASLHTTGAVGALLVAYVGVLGWLVKRTVAR